METIDLNLDDQNELLFKVQIEGANEAPQSIRLVCEGKTLSYMFAGEVEEEGNVCVRLPKLDKQFEAGTYSAKLEVLIENRYFVPLTLNLNFKQPIKVVAEAVQAQKTIQKQKETAVTASIVIKPKPTIEPKKPMQTEAKIKTGDDIRAMIRQLINKS